MQRTGKYPPPPGATDILGLECVGYLIDEDGSINSKTRVMALLKGGGYADIVKTNRSTVVKLPEEMDFELAAACTETWATAFQILHFIAKVQAGETVLVHAGASGVGLALIQLAKAANMRVIATTSCPEKLQVCSEMGADLCINYKEEDFSEKVK